MKKFKRQTLEEIVSAGAMTKDSFEYHCNNVKTGEAVISNHSNDGDNPKNKTKKRRVRRVVKLS